LHKTFFMKQILLIYGSCGNTTKSVAARIAGKLENVQIQDVANLKPDELRHFDNLIFGTSTWGYGDLQQDWEAFLPKLEQIDLSGKTIALFGLGDSCSNAETFVDGMGILYETVTTKGATCIGAVPTTDYEFDASKAVVDSKFVGLALDEDNEFKQTDTRIESWIQDIKPLFQ
jgi:flavodoxin I